MKVFKKLFTVAAMATCVSTTAMAQSTEWQGRPHMFFGIQGGGQTTLSDYDQFKLITPTASVSFGAWFTPVVGARLHLNGLWNKGGIEWSKNNVAYDNTYEYKYVTSDLDLMINLSTLFGKKDYYPLNVYLIGGIGLNTAWDNDEAYALKEAMPLAWNGTRLSHNARVGAQVDYNLSKNLSVNLEVAANSLSDRYNSITVHNNDDWQLTAQLGLAVKFGYKAKKVEIVEEVWETQIDTIWYDDVTYKDVIKPGDIDKRIFFEIRESDIASTDEQIAAVADFLKGVEGGEITIKSYADRGTGNPTINMGYSQQRAEKTKQALIDKGVDPAMIKSVEYFGDTVQPYEENDKNRVSIIVGHGTYKQKEKVVTKKFKTEEKRIRVK